MRKDADGTGSDAFPRRIAMHGIQFDLAYRFDPGASDDGVTMTVPLFALNQVDGARCEWLVPGMLKDKVAALIKSLPQKLRRHVVPAPEYVEGFVERWSPRVAAGQPAVRALIDALLEDLRETVQLRASATDFKLESVPPHLTMNFRLVDEHGGVLAMSRSLAELRAAHGSRAQTSFQQALAGIAAKLPPGQAVAHGRRQGPSRAGEAAVAGSATGRGSGRRSGGGEAGPADSQADARTASDAASAATVRAGERFTDWTFGPLPELMELRKGRDTLIGYPALVDFGDAVELQVFDDPATAHARMREGLRRLFVIALKEPLRFFERNIPESQRLGLLYTPFGGAEDLRGDLVDALIDRACLAQPWPNDATSFAARVAEARPRLNLIGQEIARTTLAILTEHQTVTRKLAQARSFAQALADIEQQLDALLPRRFVSRTPAAQLAHLPRYLKAIAMRLDKLRADSARDAQKLAELAPLQASYRRLLAQRKGEPDPRLDEFRWLLEELRVSLFAQELRTPMPVSVKRLQKAFSTLSPSASH